MDKKTPKEKYNEDYVIGVRKPISFVDSMEENKHGVTNKVVDLKTGGDTIVNNIFTSGNMNFDSSNLTGPHIYTLQNIDGTITLQNGLLTSTRIPYINSNGLLFDSALLSFTIGTPALNIGSAILDVSALTGTQTFTFPNNTGTISLTSDLTSFITLSSLSAVSPIAYDNSTGEFSLTGLTGFGTSGQVIKTNTTEDGLEWGSSGGSGSPSGNNTNIQFNDNGSFGGSDNIRFDKTPGGVLYLQASDNSLGNGGDVLIYGGSSIGKSNGITSVSVNNGGTGYTTGDTLTLTSGDGNATVFVDLAIGGIINTISVDISGTGYSIGTSNVTGGTGNDDAIINIDTLIDDGYGANVVLIPGSGVTQNGHVYVADPISFGAFLDTSLLVTLDRTFSFPDKSGTFAMTSDIGSYVPYTGATGSLDMGNYYLTANSIYTYPLILKNINTLANSFTINSTVNSQINFFNHTNNINYIVDSSLLNADRTYTLPNTTGTLALTSDIGSCVPYTGANANVDLGVYELVFTASMASPSILNYSSGLALNLGTASNYLTIKDTTANYNRFDFSGMSSSRTWAFPNLDGTVALLSNIPDGSAYATSAQGTNADTAYGWGNHASAGYFINTSTATDTFTTVDGKTVTVVNGIITSIV